jgi:16S rRNA processing protein RimM
LHTDFPERMKKGRKLFVGEIHKPMTLTNVRPHGTGMLVKFNSIDTPEDASQYRNQWVYVRAKDVPLPDDQHYRHELLGLHVVDENDHPVGELIEILETGANDVYVVQNDSGKEILLPNIPSVVLDLDLERGFLKVHLLEWL